MDIWIIQNGEKTGPLHDFEIRGKIERGELPPATPAWHEGLDAWKPLVEIPLFEREFDKPEAERQSPYAAPESLEENPEPPPAPEGPHLVRRFWARWFDLYLFAGLWWLAMYLSGRDVGEALINPWVNLLRYVPWFVLESILLHRYGTTPGKWLLGIKVVNDDGSLLTLADATRRSARVLFIGLGFGWDILSLICQLMGFITTKRIGRPLWDHAGGHRLAIYPLNPFRIVTYVFVLFASLQLQAIVILPYLMEQAVKESPPLKEMFEKYPPWHLPKRR